MLVFSKPVAQSKHGRIDWQVLRTKFWALYAFLFWSKLMHLRSTPKKKRKSSTKRKETQNRLIRPSSASIWWKLPRHGVVACRNCQGNIPIMVRSQKCNLYSASTKSAGGKVTTRNTADQKYAFMKDWWPFFCRLIKPSFFLEALMIGFLWGFQDSKWRFRFDPMLLLFQCLQ